MFIKKGHNFQKLENTCCEINIRLTVHLSLILEPAFNASVTIPCNHSVSHILINCFNIPAFKQTKIGIAALNCVKYVSIGWNALYDALCSFLGNSCWQ